MWATKDSHLLPWIDRSKHTHSAVVLLPLQARPSTMRLPRPSRNITVPVITSSASTPSRPGKKTSSLRSFLPRGRRKQVEEVFTGPKNRVKVREVGKLYLSTCTLMSKHINSSLKIK